MPAFPARPCRHPGCPSLVRGKSYCLQHQRLTERDRGSSTRRGYDRQWRNVVAKAIKAQPWCSDCLTEASPNNPLTGDHIRPLSRGGTNDPSNIRVLCRRCNSRRGAGRGAG